MKRQSLAIAFIFLMFSFGCSRPDRPAGSGPQISGPPEQGDWIIVRYETEPDTFNPITSTTTVSTYVQYGMNGSQVFELLLRYNTEDWTFTEPLLAESYPEISEDHLVYTFTIREGVKWHDGQPFTAEDVLFSVKAAMSPFVDSAPQRSYFIDLNNVEIIEGRKIRFTFQKANFLNVINLGSILSIAPKHIYDAEGALDGFTFRDIIGARGRTDEKIKTFAKQFNAHPAGRAPIGTGPYKFEKWDTGQEIVLVRNDDYWGKKAHLDKQVIRVITDSPAALTALKAGSVDMNPRLTAIQFAQQTSGAAFDAQFAKARYSIPSYTYIGWNPERPFFKDKRVRQAMTMLVNRQQILDTIRFGLGKVIVGHFNPSSPDHNPNLQPLPYDPKRAAALLDEAGWKDTNGDGIRDKDGIPFRFEFLGSAGSAFVDQLMPIMKEELRKAGIDMTERRLEFNVLVETIKDHKFDGYTAGWTSGLVSDPYQLWHSSSIVNKGSNYVSFRNAEADQLLEQARLEFDDEKRKQLYWRWQEIVHEEQPYTFLFVPEEAAAYDKRFQNVAWMPARPGYDLSSWFVPKLAQKYTVSQTQ
jgi:peptide/nickel transport system substrate-binding protein